MWSYIVSRRTTGLRACVVTTRTSEGVGGRSRRGTGRGGGEVEVEVLALTDDRDVELELCAVSCRLCRALIYYYLSGIPLEKTVEVKVKVSGTKIVRSFIVIGGVDEMKMKVDS